MLYVTDTMHSNIVQNYLAILCLQKMEQMMIKVLHQCDTLQTRSVAFPAIATGQLGFPTDIAANIML